MNKKGSKDRSFGEVPSSAEPVSGANISYEELLKIKQRFEEMQKIAQFGTWDWDIKNDRYVLSDGACRIYGLDTKANILDCGSIDGFKHPDDREPARASLRAAIDEKKHYSLDYRVVRPDGEIRHLHEYGSAVYDNGNPVRAFGSIKDNTENMKMQEKIKESEFMYRTLVENTIDAFLNVELVFDESGHARDFRYIQVNDRFEEHTGINPSEAVGRLASEAEPDIEPYWLETFEEVSGAGKPMHYQNFHKGTDRWYDMYCFPYTKGHVGAIFRDITQLKAAEEALREANESNRQLLDSINDGYGMFGRDTTILKVGKKFADMFGKTPEECIGMKLTDYLPGGKYEALGRQRKEFISRVFDTGKQAEFQDTRDGRWYNHRCYPVFKDGGVNAVSIFSTDITDSKKAEEEALKNAQLRLEAELLKQKEQEYLELLDGPKEGMRIIDFRKEHVEFSQNWAQRLGIDGFPPEELFRDEKKLIHADDLERVHKERREAEKNGLASFTQEYRILTEDSGYIWILDRGKILYDENGAPAKVYASSMDITERKRAEEALSRTLIREKVLGNITSRLLESEDPQAVIEDICRETVGYIEGDVFFNYICDGGRLHLNACSGIPLEEAEKLEWLDFGEAVCGCAAKEGKKIVVTDVQASADPKVQPLKFFGLRCYASFPLKSDDHIIGTLAFGSRKQDAFTDDELLFLSSVSEHVAIAMNRLIISKALRESEERYRELIRYAPAGIYEIDFRTQKLLSANDAMCRIMGYSKEEILAMDPFDLLDEQGKAKFEKRIVQWLAGEKPEENVDFCVNTRDGRKIYAELNVSFTRDEDGRPKGAVVAAHDITERKKDEEKISRQNLILQTINRVYSESVTCATQRELGKTCLSILRSLVGNNAGFIGQVEEDGMLHDIAVSMGTEPLNFPESMQSHRRINGTGIVGLFRSIVENAKSVLTNDPSNHPDSTGIPEGHFKLNSFLGVPFVRGGKVLGLIGLANKTGGFCEEDRDIIEAVTPSILEVLIRKSTEEALSESKSKYEQLVKYAPAGIFEMDLRKKRITYVNEVLCSMLGYSREELLEIDPVSLIDERGKATFFSRVDLWLKGKTPKRNVDYKVRTKGGQEIYISMDVSLKKDEDGHPFRATAIVHDITQRKKDEDMINRKNRILQVINHIHEKSVSCETMNELELACLEIVNAVTNSGVSLIGELKGERLIYEISLSSGGGGSKGSVHRRLGRLNHAGLFKDVIDIKDSLLISGSDSGPRGTGVAGSDIEISSFIGVPFIRDGNAAGLIAAANRKGGYREDEKEILEALAPAIFEALLRKRAEEALKESEERLADEFNAVSRIQKISASFVQEGDFESILYNVLKAAIMISGAYKGTLQLLRPGTEYMEIAAQFGFEEQYVELFSPVSRSNTGVYAKAFRQEERVIVEDVTKSPIFINSPALDIHLAAGVRAVQSTPLISRRSKVIGILSTHWDRPFYPSDHMLRYIDLLAGQAADIIERKWAEEELRESEECALALVKKLEEADRNKNDFLNALSHEIRNPLATISAGLQLMDISHDETHIKNAREIINRQMDQLCSLVDDLLDLTRISNNRVELKKQRVDIGRLVSLVAKDHIPLAAKDGLRLETELGEDIYIEADPVRIKQIIGNMLQNAFKFTEAGVVKLSVYEENGQAVISVKDPGIGIRPENLSRIFEPFMQLGGHLGKKSGGLGLGLSIVKAIAQLHGGDVGVFSEGEGKGSEFFIRLPAENSLPAAQETNGAGAAGENLKVLLIEDNEDYSEMMCELLRFLGHQVTCAQSGVSGIKKAKEDVPDVIICDIGLPGINGFETARRLKEDEELNKVFLVSITGFAGPQYAADAQKAGFDLYIKKPADINALKHILNEASNKRRA